MPLLIKCECGKKLQVRDELAGKKVKCPGCGKVIVAPAPAEEEPIDLEEAIVEVPPLAPARKPVTAVKSPPPAWATPGKKKKPPPLPEQEFEEDEEREEDDHDDDDEERKPTPYWLFPGTLSTEVMALAVEGIWFASLKGDALKQAELLLKQGDHPGDVLGKKAWSVTWEAVYSIFCNRKLKGFTIHYDDGNEGANKVLKPADAETRDEILETVVEFLEPDWQMITKSHTPVTAMFAPLGGMAADFVVTAILAVISYFLRDGQEARNNVGGRAGRGFAGLYNLLRDLGPLWISVIGLVIAACLGVWLLVRILSPPIEVTIVRKPEDASDEEED